jgi:hypothetical protein
VKLTARPLPALAILAALVLVAAAGCSSGRSSDAARQAAAADLADTLREQALALPDAGERDRLVTGLIQLRDILRAGEGPLVSEETSADGQPKPPAPAGAALPVPRWASMFNPASLVIGFFTRSKDFDGVPGDDGLEVRLQPLDQFGDPTKAVGSYRIEVFAYHAHSVEKRGERLGHWFVSVLDVESNRKYYDPVDRSYVFPLLWSTPIPSGTSVIVQATFYPPGGMQEKLFAQRIIKIGSEE